MPPAAHATDSPLHNAAPPANGPKRCSTVEACPVCQATFDMVLTLDPEGTVTDHNCLDHCDRGFDGKDAVGAPLLRFVHDHDRQRVADALACAAGNRQHAVVNGVAISCRDDQWRSFNLSLCHDPARVDGQRSLIVAARDVTDQVVLEDRLEGALRSAAATELMGSAAHDFNNFLMAIRTGAEAVADMIPPNSEAQEELDEVVRAARKAGNLASMMLNSARAADQHTVTLDLNRLVTENSRLLRRVTVDLPTIELTVDTLDEPALIRGNPERLEQVLLNLVRNARDAIDATGRIALSVACCNIENQESLSQGTVVPGPYVQLTVSDTGCGIPSHLHEAVFDTFFTTKAPGQGTGLGLSSVARIVQKHNGALQLTSAPAQGTTFTLYFPRVSRQAHKAC